MTRQLWSVEVTRQDGSTFTEGVHDDTATHAVEIMRAIYPGAPVRLYANPGIRTRAAYAVARDQVKSEDAGWILVSEAISQALDTLRLPEAPYVAGAYPLEDYGDWESAAYRIILESTPDEIAALRLNLGEGSVRA